MPKAHLTAIDYVWSLSARSERIKPEQSLEPIVQCRRKLLTAAAVGF